MHNCQIQAKALLYVQHQELQKETKGTKNSPETFFLSQQTSPSTNLPSGETRTGFGAAWTGQGTRCKKWWEKKSLSLAMYLPLNRKLQPLTSTSAFSARRRAEETHRNPLFFFPHLMPLTLGHFGFLDYFRSSTDKVFNCSYP